MRLPQKFFRSSLLIVLTCLPLAGMAETWEASTVVQLWEGSTASILFSQDSMIATQPDYCLVSDLDTIDACVSGACETSTEISCSFYLSGENPIHIVLDTSRLVFDDTLNLSDTSTFQERPTYYSLGSGAYGLEEFFVLDLFIGAYALCHGSIEDTSWIYNSQGVYMYNRMYLACQVQDDGTTKFDSIPQYPYDTTESVLRTPAHTDVLTPQGPSYRVNGARATVNGAVGVRVRAVGKE